MVGSLQTLRLNGGQWGWPLSKLNCFTPLRVKKIDSKGPFFGQKVIIIILLGLVAQGRNTRK